MSQNREEEGAMSLNRKQMIGALAVNCACQGDRAALNALSTETLERLLQNTMGAAGDPEDAEEVGGYDEDEDNPGESEEGEEVSEADEDAGGKTKGDKKLLAGDEAHTSNAARRFLKIAPPEIRELLANGLKARQQEKVAIVRMLTANKKHQRMYLGLDLEELKEILHNHRQFAANFGARRQMDPSLLSRPLPNYAGAADPGPGVTPVGNSHEEPLPIPNTIEQVVTTNASEAAIKWGKR